jgi:aminoglycoside phosphotransferase (APT) family kinase protein
MRALWESELRQRRHVLIAEPLGYLSDEKVLVQAGIANDGTFQALLQSSLEAGTPGAIERVGTYIDEAAVALAELHACGARPRHVVTVGDQIADVRALLARLGEVMPELAGAETTLLASLEALAGAEPPDTPRPAHGSFRPAQLLLTGNAIALIDFDGFCLAEPAMDVARFRAIVKEVALKTLVRSERPTADGLPSPEHLALVDELSDRFLERYLWVAPISRSRVALWEALDLLTLVIHGWTKLKLNRLGARLALLRRHLRAHELQA